MEESIDNGGLDGVSTDESAAEGDVWVHRGNGVPYVETTDPRAQPKPPLSPDGSRWASILRQEPATVMARSLDPAFPKSTGVPSPFPTYSLPPIPGMGQPALDTAMLPAAPETKGPLVAPKKAGLAAVPWWIWAAGALAGVYWVRRYRGK